MTAPRTWTFLIRMPELRSLFLRGSFVHETGNLRVTMTLDPGQFPVDAAGLQVRVELRDRAEDPDPVNQSAGAVVNQSQAEGGEET